MSKYILNTNKQDSKSGKNYEVHNEEICNRLPIPQNRATLGYFSNCHEAMKAAKAKWPAIATEIDGCYYCCAACHKE